jgi:hypothetical protein
VMFVPIDELVVRVRVRRRQSRREAALRALRDVFRLLDWAHRHRLVGTLTEVGLEDIAGALAALGEAACRSRVFDDEN